LTERAFLNGNDALEMRVKYDHSGQHQDPNSDLQSKKNQ